MIPIDDDDDELDDADRRLWRDLEAEQDDATTDEDLDELEDDDGPFIDDDDGDDDDTPFIDPDVLIVDRDGVPTVEDTVARLAAAAAAAPTTRADGSFVFTLEARCRECGCSNGRACPGGCIWLDPTLCSRCAPGRRRHRKAGR